MTEQPWKAIETRVYTDDGGFDIRDLPNAIDRAAFIVKAVNSHDALVEAAQNLIEEISTRGTHERWKRLANLLHDLVESPKP